MVRWLIRSLSLSGVAAVLALAAWPPASGKLLLVPLGDTDANPVARVAVAGGALLLGSGPFPGSMVVEGDRARVARGIVGWQMVILAAPPAGCLAIGQTERVA